MRNKLTACLSVSLVLAVVGIAQAKKPQVAYPPTQEGLHQQIDDLVAAAQSGRRNLMTTHVNRLKIPGYRNWFAGAFGAANAYPLIEEYEGLQRRFGEFQQYIGKVVAQDKTFVHITELQGPDDTRARGLQKRAFLAMQRHQHLYMATLTRPDEKVGTTLWSFVYVDGAFRFAGKMRALTKVPLEPR